VSETLPGAYDHYSAERVPATGYLPVILGREMEVIRFYASVPFSPFFFCVYSCSKHL